MIVIEHYAAVGEARGLVKNPVRSILRVFPSFVSRRLLILVLADLERTNLANCVCSNAAFTRPFEDF